MTTEKKEPSWLFNFGCLFNIAAVPLGSFKHTAIFDVSIVVSPSKWCKTSTQCEHRTVHCSYCFNILYLTFSHSCLSILLLYLPRLWTILPQPQESEETQIFLFCRKTCLESPACYKHACVPQLSIFDISAKKTNVRTPCGCKEHTYTYGFMETPEFVK